MLAPYRFALRLALSIIVVAMFALAYLVALALEAPEPRTAAMRRAGLPDSSTGNLDDLDRLLRAADLSAPAISDSTGRLQE